jgi:hypothetical protein
VPYQGLCVLCALRRARPMLWGYLYIEPGRAPSLLTLRCPRSRSAGAAHAHDPPRAYDVRAYPRFRPHTALEMSTHMSPHAGRSLPRALLLLHVRTRTHHEERLRAHHTLRAKPVVRLQVGDSHPLASPEERLALLWLPWRGGHSLNAHHNRAHAMVHHACITVRSRCRDGHCVHPPPSISSPAAPPPSTTQPPQPSKHLHPACV